MRKRSWRPRCTNATQGLTPDPRLRHVRRRRVEPQIHQLRLEFRLAAAICSRPQPRSLAADLANGPTAPITHRVTRRTWPWDGDAHKLRRWVLR